MLSADVKLMIFATLDQAAPNELADPAAVRDCLYRMAVHQGHDVTDALERYIDLLIEEFCPLR
jgi:hypothetical protein